MADKQWYAVHTYSGFENKVKKSVEETGDGAGEGRCGRR